MIVLSQPGGHLAPLQEAASIETQIPKLTDSELQSLATQLGVLHKAPSSTQSFSFPTQYERDVTLEFVAVIAERSGGNALYATYLCREVLRSSTTSADPIATLHSLPQFDEGLHSYYQYIQTSLGTLRIWVADILALLDFSISRSELKEIRPTMGFRVDEAVDVMKPVLTEMASQGGLRIYHESFARFLRLAFQEDTVSRDALYGEIIEWLKNKGMFCDARAFRYLTRFLSQSNRDKEVVDAIDRDFVSARSRQDSQFQPLVTIWQLRSKAPLLFMIGQRLFVM